MIISASLRATMLASVVITVLSLLIQTNIVLVDLVNILSKLPSVTIEPYKQERKLVCNFFPWSRKVL